MQPEIDLDFLAEASPRESMASPVSLRSLSPLYRPRATGKEDLKPFLETSVRSMAYRAFIRWYHGSFSGQSKVSRLLLNYYAAVATMLAVYTFVCVDINNKSDTTPEDIYLFKGFYLTNGIFLVLSTLIFSLCSQTTRIVVPSVWGSRLFMMSSFIGTLVQFALHAHLSSRDGRLQYDSCPTVWPSFAFPITLTMLLSFQMVLALIALSVDLLAIRIGRFYILYSKLFLRSWAAEILESRRNSKVTIRACPFGLCHGKQSHAKRWFSILHLLRHGRQVCFTPTETYLPPGCTTAAVKPCCPFCSIYVGEVDERLRPHGLGVWQQGCGDRYGEYLNGTWEFG